MRSAQAILASMQSCNSCNLNHAITGNSPTNYPVIYAWECTAALCGPREPECRLQVSGEHCVKYHNKYVR